MPASWPYVAAAYGAVMIVAAVVQPIRRRVMVVAAATLYTLTALALGAAPASLWVHLPAPGVLLLTGYWLSGFYFRTPQPWLEAWLQRIDHACRAQRWSAWPRPVSDVLELSYAAAYVVVGGSAIYAASFGVGAVRQYWTLVLAAELTSFAALPWLRSRPPRVTDPHATPRTDSWARRLNAVIVGHASIQANTLPSGHVAGALAAALAVMTLDGAVGWGLVGAAGVIAVAAIAGRYHYVVDCVAGAMVAFAFSSLM